MASRGVFLTLSLSLILLGIVAAINDKARFDCYPDGGNQTLCESRGCTWEKSATKGVPWCFYPENIGGYKMIGDASPTNLGMRITLKRRNYTSIYGNDVDDLTLDIEFQTNKRLRFKFYDGSNARYEVPIKMPIATSKAAIQEYEVKVTRKDPFAMQIIRKATGTVIWDSSVGAFIFSDQFLQISTKTSSKYMYGIGEQEHTSFRHDMQWKTWPLFTRDQFPFNKGNVYGHHAFHMGLEEDGKAHGIFLLNSNAMEIVLQPLPAITYRTIGGVLDFYLFLGPTSESVVQQYTEAIGRTFMPPYWSLGFMLSRWGYNSLGRVKDVVERMRRYDIPQDVQFGDIDYMIRQLDFTYNKQNFSGLPDWIRAVKKDGLRYVIILDPAIGANETTGTYRPYDLGSQMDVWVKNNDGNPLFGKVWPTLEGVVVNGSLSWDKKTELYRQWATFPDFFHSNIDKYWGTLIEEFYKTIEFDGLWIDMNEPANFVKGAVHGCPNTKYDNPPYKPKSVLGEVLADKTLCMSAQHETGKHYDLHSLYGWKQSVHTQSAARNATGKRSMVFSRSTFPSSGVYSGHWLGDNLARWDQLHISIIGMLEFNMFGIPYIGADIGGFFDHPDAEMLVRWTQLGAFYPFCRNHNGFGNLPQDPASYDESTAAAARKVLRMRYNLLPYLYTLFYQSRKTGSTVVRSLLSEFTSDKNTWTVDRQFLWGSGLLISPVLDKGKTSVDAYVPDARWYDYYTGKEVSSSSRKKTVTWNCPLDHVNVHFRGGHVIPTQEPANNTMFSRKNKMGLVVALCKENTAKGELFWDDGESVDTAENGQYLLANFSVEKNTLTITAAHKGYPGARGLKWGTVLVYGIEGNKLDAVKVNEDDVTKTKASFSDNNKALRLTNLDLGITDSHKITWAVRSVPASAPTMASHTALFAVLLTTIIVGLVI